MSITLSALTYLHCFDKGLPVPNGMAFEAQLRQCRLDYSVASLGRIDALLDWLRQGKKMDREGMLGDPAQQNLLYFINFYVGEVIARHLRWPATWYDFNAVQSLDPMANFDGKAFENSATLAFPGHPSAGTNKWFRPLISIVSRLFPEHASVKAGEDTEPEKSVLFSAGFMLPADMLSGEHAMRPLPPVPPPAWPIDVASRLKETPALLEQLLPVSPDWNTPSEPVSRLFDNSAMLLREGRVVMGVVLRAREVLLRPGADLGAPGDVIYDPRGLLGLDGLIKVHESVNRLMHKQPPYGEDVRPLAEHFQNEDSYMMGAALPSAILPYPVHVATTFFERRNLPSRHLAGHAIPLLVCDTLPGLVMPLPARFWTEDALDHWFEEEAAKLAAARAAGIPAPYVPDPELSQLKAVSVTEEGLLWFRQKEYERARLAWQRAAATGNAAARCGLGELYENGFGVEKDIAKATALYKQAAAQNYGRAIEALARLTGQPTPAKQIASPFVPGATVDMEALLNQRMAVAGIDFAGMARDKEEKAARAERRKRLLVGCATLFGGIVLMAILYSFFNRNSGMQSPALLRIVAGGLIVKGLYDLARGLIDKG